MNRFVNKIFNWYFSRKAVPFWIVLSIDCLCVLVGGIIAFAINHSIQASIDVFWTLFLLMVGMTAFYLIGFRVFHTYLGIIRYSSFSDLLRIFFAVLLAMALLVTVEVITGLGKHLVGIRTADIVLTGLFVIGFMWVIRIYVKILHDSSLNRRRNIPVFIYGVKKGGVAIANSINAMEHSPYKITAFVTGENDIADKKLMGFPIYRFDHNLPKRMASAYSETLLVSPLMMESLREDEQMLNKLIDAGIKIMVMPRAREWHDNDNLDVKEMRQVEPEDLLPRDKIEINLDAAAQMINDKVVLITGAAGSIGSEIVRQVAEFSPKCLVLIDQAETPMHDIRLMMKNNWPNIKAFTIVASITDKRYMNRIFSLYRPDYVFHAAAYKHVPMMEDNPYEAVMNNVWGTKVIADLAVKYDTKKFVMVSTDKAVNPTNVMGCSKRICEIYVQSLNKAIKDGEVKGNTRFVTTRFGNVLGSNGSVIPIFQEQIRKGGPVTVTHKDIIRYFMLIPEACKLVIEAGTMGQGGEIFVFDMGQPVRIADLAEKMIKLSGAKNIEIKYTGLRDGEKLFEEVLNDKETTLPTFHPKIKIAKVRKYDYKVAEKELETLMADAEHLNDMEIVAEMKRIVPEFKSQHSIYEVLDKDNDNQKPQSQTETSQQKELKAREDELK